MGETQEFRFFRFVSISPKRFKKNNTVSLINTVAADPQDKEGNSKIIADLVTKLKNDCDCGKDPSHDESHTSVFGIRRKCSGRVLRNTTSSSSLFALTTKQRVV